MGSGCEREGGETLPAVLPGRSAAEQLAQAAARRVERLIGVSGPAGTLRYGPQRDDRIGNRPRRPDRRRYDRLSAQRDE